MRKVLFLLCLMTLVAGASFAASVQIDPKVYDAVDVYARSVGEQPIVVGPLEKAVPRTDKAEAQIIGSVLDVDSLNFTSDGTPFRIIALNQNRPVSQFILVVCLGSSSATTCGRLTLGKRVYFTADLLVIQSGDNAGFPLLIGKRLQI